MMWTHRVQIRRSRPSNCENHECVLPDPGKHQFCRSAWRRKILLALRTAFLLPVLAIGLPIHAQQLPILQTLPVTVIAGDFIDPGNGQKNRVSGVVLGSDFARADSTPVDMNLMNVAPGLVHDHSRFLMYAVSQGASNSIMMIHLTATTKRCLSTTFDPTLAQANEPGRVIEVRSMLLHNLPKYHEIDNPLTLCTADSGKLALYFSRPGFDMVRLTAVSFGSPSNKLRSMNTQSVMLYFPTTAAKRPS